MCRGMIRSGRVGNRVGCNSEAENVVQFWLTDRYSRLLETQPWLVVRLIPGLAAGLPELAIAGLDTFIHLLVLVFLLILSFSVVLF